MPQISQYFAFPNVFYEVTKWEFEASSYTNVW